MDSYAFALEFAARAHKGQTDQSGVDYIRHPIAVSEKLTDEQDRITALLHDILEDTAVTEPVLRLLFGDTVTDAVVELTRREDETYEAFILRAKCNPISRRVKLADLAHNSDLSRLPVVTEKDLQRLEKYKKATKVLLED